MCGSKDARRRATPTINQQPQPQHPPPQLDRRIILKTISQRRGARDRIRERELKKRKKPQRSCRRDVGSEEDLGEIRKKCGLESVGSVAADPDKL